MGEKNGFQLESLTRSGRTTPGGDKVRTAELVGKILRPASAEHLPVLSGPNHYDVPQFAGLLSCREPVVPIRWECQFVDKSRGIWLDFASRESFSTEPA